MKSIREKFVKEFGEEQATMVEKASDFHDKDIHNNKGSDPFKWSLLIAIGYECIDRYKDYHKITIPTKKLKDWIKNNADLGSHDGDSDYLSLAAGSYKEYVKQPKGDK